MFGTEMELTSDPHGGDMEIEFSKVAPGVGEVADTPGSARGYHYLESRLKSSVVDTHLRRTSNN